MTSFFVVLIRLRAVPTSFRYLNSRPTLWQFNIFNPHPPPSLPSSDFQGRPIRSGQIYKYSLHIYKICNRLHVKFSNILLHSVMFYNWLIFIISLIMVCVWKPSQHYSTMRRLRGGVMMCSVKRKHVSWLSYQELKRYRYSSDKTLIKTKLNNWKLV